MSFLNVRVYGNIFCRKMGLVHGGTVFVISCKFVSKQRSAIKLKHACIGSCKELSKCKKMCVRALNY
jgi:hypothetical protein